jgi:predicted lipid-binding transport protein (Tim44 family)
MKKLLSLALAIIGLSLVAIDADARRLGGGRNTGMQRSAPAEAAPKAPAQQQQAAPAATPAQQPAGASKWLGPLAGFALGAAFFGLFLNNGLAGVLAGLLLIGLVLAALVFVARALRGRAAQQPLQYAGAGAGGREPSFGTLRGGAGARSVAATTTGIPADFDAAGFLRHARLNFVKLQESHDRKDLSAMRDFLAPDVYRDIEADIRAMGDTPQHTEVLTLEAEIVEVAEEAGSYVVSVRFSGTIREAADQESAPFREIWHLQKPVNGGGGWMVAGIQQA